MNTVILPQVEISPFRKIAVPEFIKRDRWIPDELAGLSSGWTPKSNLGKVVRDCLHYLPSELAAELLERITSCAVMESQLAVRIFRRCDEHGIWNCACPDLMRRTEDYGVVSRKVVTDTGVAFIVDAFQNIVELETMKYHGLGTSAAAEAVGNTGLTTELTTQYNPNNVRATGTTIEGATANVYRTVATNTVDAAVSVEEHGVLSDPDVGEGVLLDRSLTGTKTLASGEGLQSTWDLQINSGG